MGVLDADNFVKPTMSEKYMVTSLNDSASIDRPRLRSSATDLKNKTPFKTHSQNEKKNN